MNRRGLALVCVAASAFGCDAGESTNPVPRDPLRPYPPTGITREFDFTIEETLWEVGPGAIYKAVAYNGQVPGPPIEVNAGDLVVIRLTNNTSEPRSIHTHVVEFTKENDGTDGSIVAPGETRTVQWSAGFAGTFPYHDHAHEVEGVKLGLFGALIVHAPNELPANEHLVVLADFDQA